MHMESLPKEVLDKIKLFQKIEITEYYIYKNIAKMADDEDAKILDRIGEDELRHYNQWKKYTGEEVKPSKSMIFFYTLLARIFGYTFALKLMEKGEEKAQENYETVLANVPEAKKLLEEEIAHEEELLKLVDEERLRYIGSMVLGVNDAIVELSGALAGLTFALQNTLLVGVAALITGLAAALSMGASEYLSQRAEKTLNPVRAGIYTGIAYVISVILLVFPYFVLSQQLLALSWTLINAILIIGLFTYYISVTKDYSFKREFRDMVLLSMSIAFISFLIGTLARIYFNIEI